MKTNNQILTLCTLLIISTTVFSCKKDNSQPATLQTSGVDAAAADSGPDTTASQNLIAWYTFNNGDLSDKSANGNNIVFCNAKTTTGKKGAQRSAYLFNGKGNYMQVPNSASLNPSSQITLAVLFKPKGFYSFESTTRIFMKGNDDQSAGDYYVGYNADNSLYASYGDNQFNSAGIASPANAFQLNNWYKLIYTYDGVTAKLFINGNLVSKKIEAASFNANTSPLRIGKTGRADFPYYFNGAIDEIRIYNTSLSGSQVTQINSHLGQ